MTRMRAEDLIWVRLVAQASWLPNRTATLASLWLRRGSLNDVSSPERCEDLLGQHLRRLGPGGEH
jgi:hypothetical protein